MGSVNRGSFKLNNVTNRSKVNSSAYNKNNAFQSNAGNNKFNPKEMNKKTTNNEK